MQQVFSYPGSAFLRRLIKDQNFFFNGTAVAGYAGGEHSSALQGPMTLNLKQSELVLRTNFITFFRTFITFSE